MKSRYFDLPEFRLTSSQTETSAADITSASCDPLNHLEELLGFRPWLEKLHRDLFETATQHEELVSTSRRKRMEILAAICGMLDVQRNLVVRANQVLKRDSQPNDRLSHRLMSWFYSKVPASINLQTDWLRAFQVSVDSTVNRLETLGVFYVDLHGADLSSFQHQGRSVKNWVSVKNKSAFKELIVKEVIQGLWLTELDGQLHPVLRAEVIVRSSL